MGGADDRRHFDEAGRPATADLPVHVSPPFAAPAGLASPRRRLRAAGCFCVLAITAHFDGGRLRLFLDRPVERVRDRHRSPRLDGFNHLSFLGSTKSC